MADEQDKSIDVVWKWLLGLLVVAVAGAAAILPSRSARPPASGTEFAASTGVTARLWQDPLQVAKEALTRNKQPYASEETTAHRTELATEYGNLARPLVLMVCVPDSPYAEDVEHRLRDRAAIHYALSAEGYMPRESKKLKYDVVCRDGREGRPGDTEGSAGCPVLRAKSPKDGSLQGHVIPFESLVRFTHQEPENLMVIWVGDGLLGDKPLEGLAGIVACLTPEDTSARNAPPDVRVLGPSDSGQYQKILTEIKTAPSDETKRRLSATHVYSCKATAADAILLEGYGGQDQGCSAARIQSAFRSDGNNRFSFERTVVTDDQLCDALIAELGQRHVTLDASASIVVLSEMESFYGRALPVTFRDSIKKKDSPSRPATVRCYTYMAGIDGALPKNALGAEEHPDKDKGSSKEGSESHQEPSEGHSQIDYFRRLANTLARENCERISDGGKEVQVVALLGSDIYDKLQILRTLRPRLPGALFITNDLDARYGHPDEWEETRNLLVAAGHPLEVDWEKNREAETPPPFRNTSQVAVYAAARHAMNPIHNHPDAQWKGAPQVFEIGRHGPVALSETEHTKSSAWKLAGISLLGCLLPVLLLTGRTKSKQVYSFHGWIEGTGHWLARSAIAVPLAVIASLIITYGRYISQTASIEPFAFYDGISIWPGDCLRLLVLLLAVHFLVKTLVTLPRNTETLAQDFGLTHDTTNAGCCGNLRIWRKEAWPFLADEDALTSSDRVDARMLFKRHSNWGAWGLRSMRAMAMLVAYMLLIFIGMRCAHAATPHLPVRGGAYSLSVPILMATVGLTLFVTFLVADAICLNCCFVMHLDRGRTDWSNLRKPSTGGESRFRWPERFLHEDDFADYLDIQYIAKRSNAVNRLIYFPFILIALLFAARWSQTDDYPWSTLMIVIFMLNASLAGGFAILLPMVARIARDATLQRLRQKITKQRVLERIHPRAENDRHSNSVALQAVIDEIANLREGAFVGFWEQPLLRAVLLPSSGVGLWAILDLLPR